MTRRRAPEYDYICMRCQCACRADGSRHLGGGSANYFACGKKPSPILRSEWEASINADVSALRERIDLRRPTVRTVAERLDAAESGEDFGEVIQSLLRALEGDL